MENASSVLPDSVHAADGRVKDVLIVLPLTRFWAADMQAKQLAQMHRFTDVNLHLLVLVDNAEISDSYIIDKFQKHEMTIDYTIHNTKRPAPHEIRIFYRRDRIKEMLTMLQEHIKSMPKKFDMLFMLEDDTKVQPDVLQRLLGSYKDLRDQNVNVGFIEGVQVGRHGIRMIGAWRCDDLENPTEMATIPYNKSSFFEKIDGGGLYCFITPMQLFLDHTFYWHDECFSVDVTYGIELRKKGYVNIIDWTVITGHADQSGNVLYANENCTVAAYKKQPDGTWQLQPTNGAVS